MYSNVLDEAQGYPGGEHRGTPVGDEWGFESTAALLTKLMGKGEAASRRELMELHGDAVEVDV